MAQHFPACCGVGGSVAPGGASPWDGMRDWYVDNMSPATASLASSLFSQVGLLDNNGDAPKLKVLETHCGDARAAGGLLPKDSVASYIACDSSRAMLESAAKRLGDRAETRVADSTELPFEAGSFDRYISNMGACCVSDLDAKLKEAKRVLVPGGIAAMSMRIEGFPGDTAFLLAQSTLQPFGMPPGPDREGLHLGKDLPKLRNKLTEHGFKNVKAWRTWVTIPLPDDSADSFVKWATCVGPVAKFLGSLPEDKKIEAIDALRNAAVEPQNEGAVQCAVAAVTAVA